MMRRRNYPWVVGAFIAGTGGERTFLPNAFLPHRSFNAARDDGADSTDVSSVAANSFSFTDVNR